MSKKNGNKVEYRNRNFIAKDNREKPSVCLEPSLLEGLKQIAKMERKSVSWVVEEALSDYFNLSVKLRKIKTIPKPAYPFRG